MVTGAPGDEELNPLWPGPAELAVTVSGVVLLLLAAAGVAYYFLVHRRRRRDDRG